MAVADAKSTPSYFLGPIYISFIMQLLDLWWQYRSEFSKAKLCDIGSVQYVQKTSLTGIGPRFVRNINKIPISPRFIQKLEKSYWAYSNVNLCLSGRYHFRPFWNCRTYFKTYVTPMTQAHLGGLKYIGPRN